MFQCHLLKMQRPFFVEFSCHVAIDPVSVRQGLASGPSAPWHRSVQVLPVLSPVPHCPECHCFVVRLQFTFAAFQDEIFSCSGYLELSYEF